MEKSEIQSYVAHFFNCKTKNIIINTHTVEGLIAKANVTVVDPGHVSGPVALKHYDVVVEDWKGVQKAEVSGPEAYELAP